MCTMNLDPSPTILEKGEAFSQIAGKPVDQDRVPTRPERKLRETICELHINLDNTER